MTQLLQALNNRKAVNGKGLIVYVTAGYPNYETTLQAVLAAAEAGADVIEIGMPFSDPMADGPIIQKAATEALKAGATTLNTLKLIKKIREHSQIPLVVMTYINSVLQYGILKFATDFVEAGLCGLIIPDLPLEESGIVEPVCRENGLNFIQFIAPTSTEERILTTCGKADGFLYCISSTGVTGIRDIDYSVIGEVIQKVRNYTDVPVAIGFGIGSSQAACAAAQYADAVIIGSAVVQRLMTEGVGAVREFVETIRKALDEGGESS